MDDDKRESAAEVEKVASMIDILNITEEKEESRHQKSLEEAILAFEEAAANLLERGTNIIKLLPAEDVFQNKDFASLYLAQTTTFELGRVGRLLNKNSIQGIVDLAVMAGDKTLFGVEDLLERFKSPIEKIVQRIMTEAQKENILREVAEKCYHQAVSSAGELNPDDYLATCKGVKRADKREDWIRFWIRSLCNCPGGPTLFQPHQYSVSENSATKPPKCMPLYLFRTYDKHSMGLNTDKAIASLLSQRDEASRHKVDILAMDRQEASERLHHHLEKGLFSTFETRNVVSWSSSLIFVIQYANYRFCNPKFGPPGEIHICALDTSKFPHGQFARDKWLLNWFSSAKFSDDEISFRNLRLNISDYNNGEYLSQGKLHIEGRSCTLSVQGLANAGLWDLYPAFNVDDAEPTDPVKTQWPKYVKYLRQKWLAPWKTTKTEVQCALDIAQECFPGFDQDDMALLLLSFRERKLQRAESSFQNPFSDLMPSVPVDNIDYQEPAEVDRYSTLRKRLSELSEASGERGMRLFEQLYQLEDTEED
ncbi:hypothetical protein FMEXI_11212 [Fusarium mexicanum]|uniref:DUF7587 domain-containing protein n=1 Tax=Fusarium mexicanum TaxID=751941 RepID=A0A8H5MMK1_9HYPO|nr:hypothetical protein FMEXI_11212 [Fusarium mexicanum]